MVPPEAVTATVFAAPRLVTVLPELSVMATFDLKVPELPSEVTEQVKKQSELLVPALATGSRRATLEAAPTETVSASGVAVVTVPSVAEMPVAPALVSVAKPFFELATAATPEVKVREVGLPKLTTVPLLLTTVA